MSLDKPAGRAFSALSDRERQVIGLAAAGLLDKQIGHELELSLNTLRTYWNRIRDKVGDAPRAALVAAYVREELSSAGPLLPDPAEHEGWVMDAETRMLTASDAINDDHELQRGVPHHVDRYMGHTHPEDAETMRSVVLEVAQGRRETVHVVFRVVTARGVEVVNATIRPIKDAAGRVAKVYGFRTRQLDCRPGRRADVLVGHWEEEDYESEVFTVDEEMARILGAPGPGAISRSTQMTWRRHPDDEARARRECEVAVAARREHLTTDVRLVLGDGSEVWGRAKRRFEYREDGRVHIYGTFMVFQ